MPLHYAESLIRDVPDFPKPGIVFKDIAPLLQDGQAWITVSDALTRAAVDMGPSKLLGVESRGFLFAAPIAYKMGAGVVLVRKPGKLPWKTVTTEYALEYGTDSIEMHIDALTPGEPVVIVDDVLATGGTAEATAKLVEAAGGTVAGFVFLIELKGLSGRNRLGERPIFSLFSY
ncbi:MAG: adenine phosphoribosyltransferase [Myxococcales bacterium]|nr:adenine phosphoribosyltransferase [Myxococcales bacterium]